MTETMRTPITICWHCDRMLDAASNIDEDFAKPEPDAVSFCLYCGAVAIFGPDLSLRPPTEEDLNKLREDPEFRKQYIRFAWARQYVMLKSSLMRDRDNPDR